MPSNFRKVAKFCKFCEKQLTLKNTRDIKRKNFCNHSCRAKFYITPEKTANMQKYSNTPEANAKKSHHGENHPFWIADRSKVKVKRSIAEMKWWRAEVYKRDKYTCVNCNKTGDNLQAHHKAPVVAFPQFKFHLENGITLCKPCHTEVHMVANELFDCGGFMNKIKGARYASSL